MLDCIGCYEFMDNSLKASLTPSRLPPVVVFVFGRFLFLEVRFPCFFFRFVCSSGIVDRLIDCTNREISGMLQIANGISV